MRLRRDAQRALFGLAALLMSTAAWADPIPGLYNTGLDASGNRIDTNGVTDPHYRVDGKAAVTFKHPAYYTMSDSQWISEQGDGGYGVPFVNGAATLTYTLSFDLTGLDPTTAQISGTWGVDNAGEMYINGIKVPAGGPGFGGSTPFSITSGFKDGLNTITFAVTDYGPPAALIVSGISGTASKAVPPAWSPGSWSDWSTTCGSATRTRTVTCANPNTGATLAESACLGTKPTTSDTSYQTSGCGYSWTVGIYGSAAPACGPTTRTRTVSCTRSDGQSADPAVCDQGSKPATDTPDTNYDTCSYSWATGAYGSPSTTCGQATQTRGVYCQRSNGETVADAQCGSAGTRPDASTSSYQTSGCGYAWKASDTWDAPVPACGATVANRNVSCLRSDGQTVGDDQCDPAAKPAAQRAATDYGTCGYAWQTTPWSDPTKTCGSSTRTRTVACARSDGTTVADASCTSPRPDTSETVADYSTCSYAWVYSDYAAPAAACGPTTSSRTARCVRQDGVETDGSQCGVQETLSRPATDYSSCSFAWNAGAWTTAPACGDTTRTRAVTCLRSDGTTAADGQCDANGKPPTSEQVSDTSACSYAWHYSEWTAPAACGAVIQTRSADCVRQDGASVPDGFCTTQRAETQRAGTDYSTCGYAWTTGAWSTPSTCGQTTRTRSVSCTRSDRTVVSDDQCGPDRPAASEQIADTSTCQYSWVQTSVGLWSVCSSGSQSRPVTAECRRSDGSVMSDASCPTSRPPVSESRACATGVTPADPASPTAPGAPAEGQVVFRRVLPITPK